MSADYTGSQYNCITVGFTSVGDDGIFVMKDIAPTQFSDSSDIIQLLESTRARTDKIYFAYEGDWYENVDDWNDANDDQFDMGTGFLANFASKGTKLTPAGAVLTDPTEMDFTGIQYVMVGNPLPRAVKFAEIEPVVFSDSSDILQKLESVRARTDKIYFAYEGDWYENVDDWNDASDDEMAAGESMLGNFASKTVKLTFPGAL